MQVICNYTNNNNTGFTYQQVYNARQQGELVYINNDKGNEICIGGIALNHMHPINDKSYAMARFKHITESKHNETRKL